MGWVHHVSGGETLAERREPLLVDSGAACHMCLRSWLPDDATERRGEKLLRTASGENMRCYGQLRAIITILGVVGREEITFNVTEVTKLILSLTKLLDNGH